MIDSPTGRTHTSEVDTTIPGLINSTYIHRVNRIQAVVF